MQVPEPWLSFLREVDQALSEPVEVHCLGGFALSILHGLPRYTSDIDFIEILPAAANSELIGIAGQDSEIGKRHKLFFQRVSVADYPEDYKSRLIDISPKGFHKLRLRALEVHDVVLSKIARNSATDRDDVRFLVRKKLLDKELLKERFDNELRPFLQQEERGVLTMQLWLEEFLGEK